MSQHNTGPLDQNPRAPRVPGINLQVALERMDGDPGLLREVINIFLEDYSEGLRELHAAAASGEPKRLQRAAHTLKGAAGNFVAEQACTIALQIEACCKAGKPAESMPLIPALEQEILAVAEELREVIRKEAA